MIKEFLKRSRDKHLFSIRKQIYDLTKENSCVVDLGCGDGELLRILSPKISYGLGIDKDEKKIKFAEELTKKAGIKNLEFKVSDAEKELGKKFDYSILMFFLHSVENSSRPKILENAKRNSKEIIIHDYDLSAKYNLLINIDEILAGHYKNFRNYLKV